MAVRGGTGVVCVAVARLGVWSFEADRSGDSVERIALRNGGVRRNTNAMDLPFERNAGRVVHAMADLFAQTFQVRRRGAAVVDQEIAVLLADLRAAAGQAAAAGGVNQLPSLHVRRIAERGAARARPHRLRGFAGGTDLRHARRDRGRRAGQGAQPDAQHHGALGQVRLPIGERQIARGQSQNRARAAHHLGPIEAGCNVAAIRAGVHHHRTADRPRNARQELKSGQAGGSGVLRHRCVQRPGPRDQSIGFDLHRRKAPREPDDHAW